MKNLKNHRGESVGFKFRAALWFRRGVWKSGKPESGIGTGIGTGTGTGTGEGTGMGRKTYIKTGTTFTLIEVNLNLIPVQIYEC